MSWERREERISGREQGQIELAGKGEGSLETVPCRGGVLVCWCDYEQQKISSQICKACEALAALCFQEGILVLHLLEVMNCVSSCGRSDGRGKRPKLVLSSPFIRQFRKGLPLNTTTVGLNVST